MERPEIAIIAAGEMGAGLGKRLVARGLHVRTSLAGRTEATAQRAAKAGFTNAADDAELVAVDYVLSVLPPGDAIGLAERLRGVLAAASRKPVYIDCNAIAPRTSQCVADVIAATGCAYVDAGIVGSPPGTADDPGPRIYLSGERASGVLELNAFGLDFRDLAAPAGAASALKLAYAGVTKGLTAIGAATRAAAETHGVGDALRSEVLASQPELTAWLDRAIPRFPPKAYRWVDEMEEIAAFLGDDGDGAAIYDGITRFYERIAHAFEALPLG